MSFPAIHRVVTGHDAAGRAMVSGNGRSRQFGRHNPAAPCQQ